MLFAGGINFLVPYRYNITESPEADAFIIIGEQELQVDVNRYFRVQRQRALSIVKRSYVRSHSRAIFVRLGLLFSATNRFYSRTTTFNSNTII